MSLRRLEDLIGENREGRWEITPNHELRYRSKDKDEEVRIAGPIIGAGPDALIVSVTERQTDQIKVTGLASLSGTWKLNAKNQIVFEVERQSGKNNRLTFHGTWRVGDSHEIIYAYETTRLKTKT